MKFLKNEIDYLVIKLAKKLSYNSKKTIIAFIDIFFCFFCTWLSFYLRLDLIVPIERILFPFFLSAILFLPIFWIFGLYRTVLRFSGLNTIVLITIAIFFYGLCYSSIITIYTIESIPRSIGIIQPIIFYLLIICSRVIFKTLLSLNLKNSDKNKKKVIIYGAGNAGWQLALALENNPIYDLVGFIDDDENLQNRLLVGKTIYSISIIDKLIKEAGISIILLALPSISRNQRNKIIERLSSKGLIVKTLPKIEEIVDGSVSVNDIKDLNIEDILNREEIKLDLDLLKKNVESKVIMVTGAGGSIGSEICNQIINLNPKKLILLELSEFNLFKIYEQIKSPKNDIKIIPILGNVQDEKKMNEIIFTFKVDTIYHAAAYKHVPIVEENICESVKNNVFSTLSLLIAAKNNEVSNFVFISSDKAVRPTNIMGATKRLSELCVKAIFNSDNKIKTKMSIVRFGNVLESSGSVIPKFKKQINNGGPITLTHPDVTRYFMTVREAAQLVIQAGAMTDNCDVFVLDMGKSVKILEIVKKMIKLSGLEVKDNSNLDGDIEIKITGLRPGEKLYEELLIGDNPQKTKHKKILKAKDPFVPYNELKEDLKDLKYYLDMNDPSQVKKILEKIVKDYKSNSKLIDNTYIEKKKYD